jgi:hypothetical protein
MMKWNALVSGLTRWNLAMLNIQSGSTSRNCQGHTRRAALKAGFLGAAGLSMSDLLQLQAAGLAKKTDRSVILFWLDGGPSQLESYDPKPEAPLENRGPKTAIQTRLPGSFFCETLSKQAAIADKLAVIRSVKHGTGDHFAAGHWMLTGRFGATSANKQTKYPGLGACVARAIGPRKPGMPANVGLPAAESIYIFPGYHGAAYLGNAYNPFDVDTETKYLHHTSAVEITKPKCFSSGVSIDLDRAGSRGSLLTSLDRVQREIDQRGVMDSVDVYRQQAYSMLFGGDAVKAFDLTQEDPAVAERYGKNPWARYTLMARRLVEVGVPFVTVDMPHWDHHSSLEGHCANMRAMDHCVATLINDLEERGMLDRVLVLVMGEFGRTPRMNNGLPNDPTPGRDHWGDAISVMMAGGGIKGGVVVGATNSKAEFPVERPLEPQNILATVYHQLGIDASQSFLDFAGRPTPLVDRPDPIHEIIGG